MATTTTPYRETRPQKDTSQPLFSWSRLELVGVYAFILIIVLFDLLPFAWLITSSFGVKPENTSGLFFYIPTEWTLENFNKAFDPTKGNVIKAMSNSLITVGGAVLFAVLVCTLAAYTLSRMNFRGRSVLMYGVLLLQVIPATATILPLYLVMRDLKLLNTLQGVAIGLATFQIPFILWMLKGFFDSVPLELEESAWLDGASRLQALFYIVLPMALPGLGAATVLAFNGAWGHFFLPLIMLSDPEKMLLPQALFRSLLNYTVIDYGMMNAISMIYALPSLMFFFFARKYLIRGAMAGALQGQ
ncbi:MAG: carbohydrate ABC transporter permease [Chloroflexi bacterium]|nr:carbohydrate ABC transporter permease [Chloroflexota bacterium]MCC6893150.1 carbohydrate ABC transporter permease [Anaerolineae bacterium]